MNKKTNKSINKNTESKVEVFAMRISTRFNYTLFPLDIRDFHRTLMDLKFTPIMKLPPEQAAGGPGGRFYGSGAVAQKGNFIVDINTDRQFFGVTGSDPKSTLDEFSIIMNKLEEMQYINSKEVLFYELQGRYRAMSPNYSFNKYKKIGKNLSIIKEASKIFDMPMALFSLRLISDDEGPNSSNHFEIWILPTVVNPDRELGISIMYRNQEFKVFKNFIQKYEKNLLNLLNEIVPSEEKKKNRKK